jgi:putative iron-dependent peroxidase
MFVGRPPGNYDRLLDYSRAVTGTLFFVPSATFLENIEAEVAAPWIADLTSKVNEGETDSKSSPSRADGSLNIGSLKKEERNE